MQFHELIYTSAPELLEGSAAGDLGVVAKSKDFPEDVNRELESVRSYQIIDGLALSDPTCHPPRWVCGLQGRKKDNYCISRIVFAGADHTGRNTPLAHHLVFDSKKIEEANTTPASVLTRTQNQFLSQWRKSPECIDPQRELLEAPATEVISAPGTLLLQRALVDPADWLAAAAEKLLKFPRDRKSVVCVVDVEAARFAVELIADLLKLLPRSSQLQQVCVSHVINAADLPTDASLIFTYASTPYLHQCKARRDPRSPYVLDLTEGGTGDTISSEDYGVVLSRTLDGTPEDAQALGQFYDKLGMTLESLPFMADLWQSYDDSMQMPNLKSFAEFSTRLFDKAFVSTIDERRSEESYLNKLVKNCVRKMPEDCDKLDALAMILTKLDCGPALKQFAQSNLFKLPHRGLPRLLSKVSRDSDIGRDLRKSLPAVCDAHPDIMHKLLSKAANGRQDALHAASWLLYVGLPSPHAILEALELVISGSEKLSGSLVDPLLGYSSLQLSRTKNSPPEEIVDTARTLLPVLRRLIVHQQGMNGPVDRLMPVFWQTAIRAGSLQDEVEWFATEYRRQLDAAKIKEWKASLGSDAASFQQAFDALNILPDSTEPRAQPANEPQVDFKSPASTPELRIGRSKQGPRTRRTIYSRLVRHLPPRIISLISLMLGALFVLYTVIPAEDRTLGGLEKSLGLSSLKSAVPKLPDMTPRVILASGLVVVAFVSSWILSSLLKWPMRARSREAMDRRREWILRTNLGLAASLVVVYVLSYWYNFAAVGIGVAVSLVTLLWVANIIAQHRLEGAPEKQLTRAWRVGFLVIGILLIFDVIAALRVAY